MGKRRLIAALVLAVCIGAPCVEAFDRWDVAVYGDDTEANLVIAALCAGAALSAIGTMATCIRVLSSRRSATPVRSIHPTTIARAPIPSPIPGISRPLALRI